MTTTTLTKSKCSGFLHRYWRFDTKQCTDVSSCESISTTQLFLRRQELRIPQKLCYNKQVSNLCLFFLSALFSFVYGLQIALVSKSTNAKNFWAPFSTPDHFDTMNRSFEINENKKMQAKYCKL